MYVCMYLFIYACMYKCMYIYIQIYRRRRWWENTDWLGRTTRLGEGQPEMYKYIDLHIDLDLDIDLKQYIYIWVNPIHVYALTGGH